VSCHVRFSDKADAILTHRIWGMAIFRLITLLVFQAIFYVVFISDGRY
jgi:Fe2+ transport system protein B